MRKKTLAALTVMLALSSAVSAASCSMQAYKSACQCPFNGGKVDEACKEKRKDAGIQCILKAHPSLGASKVGGILGDMLGTDLGGILGGCPAVDRCKATLEMCVAETGRCPGNDLNDCQSAYCASCYAEADACVAYAAKNCKKEAECGDGNCDMGERESYLNCCKDCRCPEGQSCVNDRCADDEEEGGMSTSTTLPYYTSPSDAGFDIFCFPFLIVPLTSLLAALARALPV
ncbi:MAG: hypothetical protein GF416_03440 [Candidatus Altiarchaeales archaeon]|nr:hypothetical protein [Candidatus Altiarchaeales archaeon]MBD3416173.1 hypothetical protein [Candidatus Altiarchaeales archaeon]